MISEKLYVLDLVGRIGKVTVVWERREAMGVDYEKAVAPTEVEDDKKIGEE